MKYVAFFFLLITFSCKSQTNDCSKFKTGTFKYLDQNNVETTIVRTDSIQTEFNDYNDIKIISKVNWVSDCEFVLTYKDILNYSNKENVIGEKINVKILEPKEHSYVCHFKSNTLDSKIEITKIE
tara:strand:+ start:4484 stop:4858 length:375 start_codon:yes stop_codon:yes gene_type:complete